MIRSTALRPSSTALAMVAAAVLAVAAGCGIGVDDQPRALQSDATTTTVTVPPTGGVAPAVLYYLREGSLLPISEQLPDNSPSTVVQTLLQPPPDDQPVTNLATSIPVGTELIQLRRDGTHTTVDLSEAFDNVQGLARQQAVGQIVMTLTQLLGIETVGFQVEGEDIAVASATRGDVDEVDACDYARLLSDIDTAVDAGLDVPSLIELGQRREGLEDACPADASIGD